METCRSGLTYLFAKEAYPLYGYREFESPRLRLTERENPRQLQTFAGFFFCKIQRPKYPSLNVVFVGTATILTPKALVLKFLT